VYPYEAPAVYVDVPDAGREAGVYLVSLQIAARPPPPSLHRPHRHPVRVSPQRFIIDFYDRLPDRVLFMHPHRTA
jgi:hypothetical protein